MQVVRDDHAVEESAGEGKRSTILQVCLQDLEVWLIGEIGNPRDISVHGHNRISSPKEEARVPAGSTRQIQHDPAGTDMQREPDDP
jgi:hypothetical protein